jgi:hypothetical protein
MKRMKVLFGNRRMMVLLTLAILVLAATALVASSASFTAASANPNNTFSAGVLKHTNSKDGSAVFDTATMNKKMKPGDTATGSVVITNNGDATGKFMLSTSALSSPVGANGGHLADTLTVVITNTTAGYTVYSGPINAVPAGAWTKAANATWAVNESNTFSFVVTFPDNGKAGGPTSGDNAYQGATMSINFDWESVSAD